MRFLFVVLAFFLVSTPVFAAGDTVPIRVPDTTPPGTLPTDLVPITIHPAKEIPSRSFRFRILQAMPERLWFSATTEVHNRLDTNTFFTSRKNLQNYAFRVNPNVSVGYNFLPNTSAYCNYFVIKDVFAKYGGRLNEPTAQSLGMGLRHDQTITEKLSAQFDIQARELWQAQNNRVFDLLPSLNLTYFARPNLILFGSTLLQLRGHEYFVPATREIDPFFSFGMVYRKGLWTFTSTHTFVPNFRYNNDVPRLDNQTFISSYEIARPVMQSLKGTTAFLRVEPVWNFGAGPTPGLSGFDCRVIGGLRFSLAKQSYAASINRLRKQLAE